MAVKRGHSSSVAAAMKLCHNGSIPGAELDESAGRSPASLPERCSRFSCFVGVRVGVFLLGIDLVCFRGCWTSLLVARSEAVTSVRSRLVRLVSWSFASMGRSWGRLSESSLMVYMLARRFS